MVYTIAMFATLSTRFKNFRIIGDVHGDINGFRHAVETNHFIIQLGDLVDYGPDSGAVMALMLQVQDEKRGIFLIGNHDRKLGLFLKGFRVRKDNILTRTLDQINQHPDKKLTDKILQALEKAPAWLIFKNFIFVHGGFHTRMLVEPPPANPLTPINALLSRTLYGETTNKTLANGYPVRRLNWVNHIPSGYTLYCGHDCRSTDGRPWIRKGYAGGTAVFMDTGAGKGGHLSWIDIPI